MYDAATRTVSCDGMPSLRGCGEELVITRAWTRFGYKAASGWLMIPALEPNHPSARFDDPSAWHEDRDFPLHFCPSCAEVVRGQGAAAKGVRTDAF